MSGAAESARAPRVRVPAAAIAALVLLVLGVLSLAPAVSTYLAQQRAVADAEARVASQEADLKSLDAQRARWDDPAYVRAQAGSRLFYVTPGTSAYRVIHSTAGDEPTPAASARADATPWTDALLQSLVAAGTTTEPAR
ncbi:septum formation initiator family protein [Amnibacterium kyonggiense]|uniref:Cell division protein FtsB n=1 Tax=Amnibacterium kyonggiense TaxID=595671 RepID=A0A4V3EBA8_9MICO|nr:septum formation initiator family protein [Amnibacterium kyonggiense]TDS80754.1 cell division protein FtsB [Amnibacterium kyonggiense]